MRSMTTAESEALLRAVEDLRGEVAAIREDADRLRRLPDPIAKALVERNFYRVLLPRELGGLGADPLTYLRMVEAFSAMDGSVGWNFAIGGGSSLLAGFVPERRRARDLRFARLVRRGRGRADRHRADRRRRLPRERPLGVRERHPPEHLGDGRLHARSRAIRPRRSRRAFRCATSSCRASRCRCSTPGTSAACAARAAPTSRSTTCSCRTSAAS